MYRVTKKRKQKKEMMQSVKNAGKNKPGMTYSEMVTMETEKKGSRIYKEEAGEYVDTQISDRVARIGGEFLKSATAEPVSLRDLPDIQKRTMAYLSACQEASSIPSLQGLARALGLSRQAVYDCLQRESPAEAARWLGMFRDCCSDILQESSLRNDCNSIVAIFIQKSQYQWRESLEIVTTPALPMGEDVDVVELQKRIEGSVVYDGDEDY